MSSSADIRSAASERLFRFTMNVVVDDVRDEVFETLAAELLDRLLHEQAAGKWINARVLGRLEQRFLKVVLEFPAASHNAAHSTGFEGLAGTFDRVGADTSSWFEQPHRAVVEDDGSDDWAVMVEELKGVRVSPSAFSVELVPA